MADLSQMSDADLQAAYAAARPVQQMSDADLIKAYQAAKPVTAKERAHAAEGGILGGLAYTATALPDAAANLYNLGKAGLGAGYQAATGKPGWDVGDPFPVGRWLTSKMDKNELTSTQAPRPDDTASRYLNTAGNVAGGVIGGNAISGLAGLPQATAGSLARSTAVGIPGAMAGQAVAEAKPFKSDAANNAAMMAAQLLGTRATGGLLRPRGELLPENQMKNEAVTAGQAKGYQFPPATTNPTGANIARETIAGKSSVNDRLSINNQAVTNEGARQDMGLPPGKGGAITDLEIATARAQAKPGYDALRGAGSINAPADFTQKLDAALSKQSGAGALSSKLADSALAGIVDDLKGKSTFNASHAMDAIQALRDKASAAYRSGESQAGSAYKSVSKVLEDAIESDLSSRGGASADLVKNFQDSRQKFAIIHSVEDNRNATTGNVLAPKLAAAIKRNDYLSGNLEIAGQAAGHAPKAFAEPTKSTGNHLGLLGALIGGGELTRLLPESWEHAGLATVAGTAAIPAARAGMRAYIAGPGQANALPRTKASMVNPQMLAGALAAGARNTQ